MYSPRHQVTFISILATLWIILGAYLTTANLFVHGIERGTQCQQNGFHTLTIQRTASEGFEPRHEDGTDLDGNELGQNRVQVEATSEQNMSKEAEESKDETNQMADDVADLPIDEIHPHLNHIEDRQLDVGKFCDDFIQHYAEKDERLAWALSDSDESFVSLVKTLGARMKKGLPLLRPLIESRGKPSWRVFHHEINQYFVYNPDSPVISRLLKDMATNPIKSFVNFNKGTQTKLLLTLSDEAIVLMKPMRFPREQETFPDHFYFNDFERHIAEIAAFHLDRNVHQCPFSLLFPPICLFDRHKLPKTLSTNDSLHLQRVMGFNRVPPTVGRIFSIDHDFNWFENTSLEENVYVSPAGNTCFFTECDMYCDSNHPICGHPDKIEVSLQVMLPGEGWAEHEDERHPWARSYSTRMLSPWQHDDEYCDRVRKDKPYDEGRRMLDLMDVAVFDFFMGNMDRHDIDLFLRFGTDTSPILLDNGRGFGKSKEDVVSILTPIAQCCQIRLSTLAKLIKLYRGPQQLSSMMRTSLDNDPLESVLTQPHLDALDRRVTAILEVVKDCVERVGDFDKVVLDDGH